MFRFFGYLITIQVFVLGLAILAGIYLPSCNARPSTPTQPALGTGPLDTAQAYLARGDQYFEGKDYSQAIADYRQAIKLKPDYAEAYNNRGFAYSLTSKLYLANSIADYTQAIQLRPNYAVAYNNRGVAYMASGRPAEAISDFNHAIQLQTNFPQAYSNRGNVYRWMGRYDLAFPDFVQAALGQPVLVGMIGIFLLVFFSIVAWIITHRVRSSMAHTG